MIQPHQNLRQGLVGSWCPSLGATGYSLQDRHSGYGQPASLVGFTGGQWVASGGATALRIGSNQYAEIASAPAQVRFTGPFSAFAWVRLDTSQGVPDNAIVAAINNTGQFIGWMIWNNAGRVNAYFQSAARATGATTVTTNTWVHVGIGFTGSLAQVWVNGRLDGSASTTSAPSYNASDPLRIGAYANIQLNDRSIRGDIDDIRIYNRALTQAEVALLATRRGIGLVPQRQRRYYPRKPWINVGGTWRNADMYQNVGGTWKLTVPYTNVGGTWR